MAKAAKKNKEVKKLGEYAFIGGVLLAILLGLIPGSMLIGYESALALLLVVLGILVGLINIQVQETQAFLIATIALLAAGAGGLQTLPLVGTFISSILTNIISFVAPAAVIVALKAVYELGR